VWAVVVAGAGLALATPAAALGQGSQAVVSAIEFAPGVSSAPQAIDTGAFTGCAATYDGPTELDVVLPSGQVQSVQAPQGSTWTLADVIRCGLSPPPGDVTDVDVLQSTDPEKAYWEPMLTADQLTSGYEQANAQPVIIHTVSDLVEYVRPWRGEGDANSTDVVGAYNAPVTIAVWSSEQPLVGLSLSASSPCSRCTFDANFSGAPPSGDVTYRWDFGDGVTATGTTPTDTHSYAGGAGRYLVTVSVQDATTNQAGVASTTVQTTDAGTTGTTPQTGAGTTQPPNAASTGQQGSSGTNVNTTPGSSHSAGTTPPPAKKTSPSAKKTTGTRTPMRTRHHRKPKAILPALPSAATTGSSGAGSGGSGPAAGASATQAPAKAPSPARPHPSGPAPQPTAVNPTQPLVSGLLISDVNPLPLGAAPLVQAAPASARPVRRAVRASTAGIVAGVLAVLALLALGAAYELRWWRRPRVTT
jgi:hypothetical protein